MQKTFVLRPEDQQKAAKLEDENRNLLAQYGALELQRKAIKKRLPALEEEQRRMLREWVAGNGIEQFSSARIEGGKLVVDVADEVPGVSSPAETPAPAPNGHAGAN